MNFIKNKFYNLKQNIQCSFRKLYNNRNVIDAICGWKKKLNVEYKYKSSWTGIIRKLRNIFKTKGISQLG